ncbi:hypothetical protein [Streptomyces europaeiscabiei]|uniref:hypothetical protein n=1 Tax=Streptomyces europaeiscabiei TaxID=146819 RepID=UPI0029B9191B|nr:hypothetical protein [Streptomyces europaeiscabiei]MDX3839580.1 hypothetical protein [Streptomyces europaeiscabiei]
MNGLTYVITHPHFRAVKVGYTTPKSKRLEKFGRRGWQPYRSLELATPEIARQIEQATLFEMRHRRYIPPYLTRNEMREPGWTETSSLGLISAREVWDVVCSQAGLVYLAPHVIGPLDGRRRNGGTPPRRVRGDTLPYTLMARTQARLERKIPWKD